MKTREELKEQMATDVGLPNLKTLLEDIKGDVELIEFYMDVLISMSKDDALLEAISICEISDDNWNPVVTKKEL